MAADLQLDTECGAQLRKIRLVGGLNRAEHISARHDQLAFLSRSDLSPPKCLQNFPVIDSE